MSANLFDKVWDLHKVGKLPSGRDQLFIGLHLVHEVTTPQAFAMLAERGLNVAFPERSFATCDHIVPTDAQARPFTDPQAEAMMAALEANTAASGIEFFDLGSGRQGIVHVIGPEMGLTQPGHDHRLRGFPYFHPRRLRHHRLRHRHEPGARRPRHADAWRWTGQGAPDQRERQLGARA